MSALTTLRQARRAAYGVVRAPLKRLAANPALPLRLRMMSLRGRALNEVSLIDPDFAFAYVVVPKAANSTVKRLLWRLRGIEVDSTLAMQALHKGPGPYLSFADLDDRQLRAVARGPGTFRFTFVRNPYSRLLSAYRDKVLNLNANHPGGYAIGLGFQPGERPSFDAFARRALAQSDEVADGHWLAQHRCAMTALVDLDFIGKMESFDADVRTVLGKIGADPAAFDPALSVNRSTIGRSQSEAPPYDDALAEQVFNHYREDFRQFGYDAHSYRDLS